MMREMGNVVACAACFEDEGLRLTAAQLGIDTSTTCPRCGSAGARKLDKDGLTAVAHSFFVRGTFQRSAYGGAPLVQFNHHQRTSISCSGLLERDVTLFEEALGIGFFLYGPRLCMVGEVDPLLELQNPASRSRVVQRILREYPKITLSPGQNLYRVRVGPDNPKDTKEYDAAPPGLGGKGRFDSPRLPVMYTSPDLDICLHECRTSADDDIFVASIRPTRTLSLLDLTAVLEEDVSEFESLDLAVHMLFLAGEHSYEITREVAGTVAAAGFDGVVYPSYFSLLRTGAPPFASSFGLLHRRIPGRAELERAKIVQNVALFGRPVAEGKVEVRCVNRVVINRVQYELVFGPAELA